MGAKRLLPLVLVIALVATVFSTYSGPGPDRTPESASVEAPPATKHDGRHVLVRFDPQTTSNKRAEAHRQNGERVDGRLTGINVDVVRIKGGDTPEQAARKYRENSDVAFAEPNFEYSLQATPNDSFYPGGGSSPNLCGLHNTGQSGGTADADIDAPEGWDVAGVATGSPWPVAPYAIGIVDTGIDATHPDLAGRAITPCYNALEDTGELSTGCVDDHGHGTHVAGTAAAIGNNGRGVVGVAPNASVHACKALDSEGSGWTADIAACVNRLVDDRASHGINVLSLSLGGPATSVMQLAVDRAAANGVLVFAAAGNDGNASLLYPAAFESVVSVAATDRNDARASFSNSNDDVELAAPGATIMSTVPGGGYQTKSGTSMATPHAAAVAALVSWHTGLTGQQLRDQLMANADDLGTLGRDPAYGYGRVNLCRALGGECAAPPPPTPGPLPTPTPIPTPTPPPTWTRADEATAVYNPAWSTVASSNARGGSYRRSRTKASKATYYFEGIGIRWIGLRTSRAGITEVRLDGVRVAMVDAYSRTKKWKQLLFERVGLRPDEHRLELIVTGKRNPSSGGKNTYIDQFSVLR